MLVHPWGEVKNTHQMQMHIQRAWANVLILGIFLKTKPIIIYLPKKIKAEKEGIELIVD